ncbi:stalk domain-containing protein [Paenibacillus spiritus]|nr:stalk domain-containing protein [Paenibacillus spiritus]
MLKPIYRTALGAALSLLLAAAPLAPLPAGEARAARTEAVPTGPAAVAAAHILPAASGRTAGHADVSVRWNGQVLNLSPAPYISNGVTMVPLSMIQKLGSVSAHWQSDEGLVRIWMTRGGVYDFKPGEREVRETAEAGRYPLAAPIAGQGSETMLPLRFIAELAGADVRWNASVRSAEVVTGRTVLAAVPGGGPRLFRIGKKADTFEGMRLEWDGWVKSFPYWKNPVDASHAPVLETGDIGGDQSPEAVIRLNAGWGTGLHLEEVHVIERRSFKEIPVDDPVEAARNRIGSSVSLRGDQVIIRAETPGGGDQISRSASSYGTEAAALDRQKIAFGSIIYYGIEGGRLTARLGGAIGNADFVGEARIVYRYEEGRYKADQATFSFYPSRP